MIHLHTYVNFFVAANRKIIIIPTAKKQSDSFFGDYHGLQKNYTVS
jgi:hypothetical protein